MHLCKERSCENLPFWPFRLITVPSNASLCLFFLFIFFFLFFFFFVICLCACFFFWVMYRLFACYTFFSQLFFSVCLCFFKLFGKNPWPLLVTKPYLDNSTGWSIGNIVENQSKSKILSYLENKMLTELFLYLLSLFCPIKWENFIKRLL